MLKCRRILAPQHAGPRSSDEVDDDRGPLRNVLSSSPSDLAVSLVMENPNVAPNRHHSLGVQTGLSRDVSKALYISPLGLRLQTRRDANIWRVLRLESRLHVCSNRV